MHTETRPSLDRSYRTGYGKTSGKGGWLQGIAVLHCPLRDSSYCVWSTGAACTLSWSPRQFTIGKLAMSAKYQSLSGAIDTSAKVRELQRRNALSARDLSPT